MNTMYITCIPLIFMGFFVFLRWVREYPAIPAKKFKKDNDKMLYRKYRKEAYWRYAAYFIAPPFLLLAISLICKFFPLGSSSVLWIDYICFLLAFFLLFLYIFLTKRIAGNYAEDDKWYFISPIKYKFIKKLKKEMFLAFMLRLIILFVGWLVIAVTIIANLINNQILLY